MNKSYMQKKIKKYIYIVEHESFSPRKMKPQEKDGKWTLSKDYFVKLSSNRSTTSKRFLNHKVTHQVKAKTVSPALVKDRVFIDLLRTLKTLHVNPIERY